MLYPEFTEVKLKANVEEGWKEEDAIYVGDSGNDMHIVIVAPEDDFDDGIREVHKDDIEVKRSG